MSDYLKEILDRKRQEVEFLKKNRISFKQSLKGDDLSVIAEIKRKSPSKGNLGEIADPCLLAKKYIAGGAAALSILTDGKSFGGSLNDLSEVAKTFEHFPILRKDFIIDPVQLEETARSGASAVLLIVAALGDKTKSFVQKAQALGLDPLVEVHGEEELSIALASGTDMIGVNNRNLKTFEIDLSTSERLAPLIPSHFIKIAESGIKTKQDALRMRKAGFDAVLIGEALVKALMPQSLIEEIRLCAR